MNKVKDKLRMILINILEIDANDLPEIIDIDNSEKWDSLAHFQIIEKLESEFNIKIKTEEIVELTGENEILNYLNENL